MCNFLSSISRYPGWNLGMPIEEVWGIWSVYRKKPTRDPSQPCSQCQWSGGGWCVDQLSVRPCRAYTFVFSIIYLLKGVTKINDYDVFIPSWTLFHFSRRVAGYCASTHARLFWFFVCVHEKQYVYGLFDLHWMLALRSRRSTLVYVCKANGGHFHRGGPGSASKLTLVNTVKVILSAGPRHSDPRDPRVATARSASGSANTKKNPNSSTYVKF